jgi:hydrogenase expression/formation protein HypC
MTASDGPVAPSPGGAGGDGTLLPVLGTPVRTVPDTGASCTIDDDGCITCGDVAVALTVVEVGAYDALCRDTDGRTETVATELVGPLSPGDQVLVHAKVALERLGGTTDALR